MLGGKTRNMSYPYEILKHEENEMKKVEALQGCSRLKANRRNMNQEKQLSKKVSKSRRQ